MNSCLSRFSSDTCQSVSFDIDTLKMAGSLVIEVAALLTIVSASSATLDWWKIGPLYQVYPASFADSNGDGWGDLQGIIEHASYLKEIGITAVWLSPIYPSPMRDNGYDASNYTDVNPIFGNMADAERLIKVYHDLGLKVVLDFVPNHTSNESTWFRDSVKKQNGKTDFYVWKDPKGFNQDGTPNPPNNWLSTFGDTKSSAWKYVPERNQFYYHVFGEYQADLNYNNKDVIETVKENLRFWLRKGVDGFRLDAVPFLVEEDFDRDEPIIPNCDRVGSYFCLSHIHTTNQKSTHRVLEEFDAVLREEEFVKDGNVRALWLEAYNNVSELIPYYGKISSPFNFQYITYVNMTSNAAEFVSYSMDYYNALKGKWPNWLVGNHDNPRVGNRMGPEMIDSMTILAQLLPGTSITFYGEEIGMVDLKNIPLWQRKDNASVESRDPIRTPMQWNTSLNAGFSSCSDPNKLYLPVNPNFYKVNVMSEEKKNTHLELYKAAVKMHHENIEHTQLEASTHGNWVVAFHRPDAKLLILTNLNNLKESLKINDLKLTAGKHFEVVLASLFANVTVGAKIAADQDIALTPRSSVVLRAVNGGNSLGMSHVLSAILGLFAYMLK